MSAHLADSGFADPALARACVRRLKLRDALNQSAGSVAALQNLLDQGVQTDAGKVPSSAAQGGDLAASDLKDRVATLSIDPINDKQMRENELLEGVNLVLQFFDTLGVGLRHGLFSNEYAQRDSETSHPAHSLSGGAK